MVNLARPRLRISLNPAARPAVRAEPASIGQRLSSVRKALHPQRQRPLPHRDILYTVFKDPVEPPGALSFQSRDVAPQFTGVLHRNTRTTRAEAVA